MSRSDYLAGPHIYQVWVRGSLVHHSKTGRLHSSRQQVPKQLELPSNLSLSLVHCMHPHSILVILTVSSRSLLLYSSVCPFSPNSSPSQRNFHPFQHRPCLAAILSKPSASLAHSTQRNKNQFPTMRTLRLYSLTGRKVRKSWPPSVEWSASRI